MMSMSMMSMSIFYFGVQLLSLRGGFSHGGNSRGAIGARSGGHLLKGAIVAVPRAFFAKVNNKKIQNGFYSFLGLPKSPCSSP
jgi:hypothetical protein